MAHRAINAVLLEDAILTHLRNSRQCRALVIISTPLLHHGRRALSAHGPSALRTPLSTFFYLCPNDLLGQMNRKKSLRRDASLKYSHAFMHFLRATLLSFLVALGGLFLFRAILLLGQGQDLLTWEWSADLLAMVWMGLRFDAKM